MSKREDNRSLTTQILANILAVVGLIEQQKILASVLTVTSFIDRQTALIDKPLKSTAAILNEDKRVGYAQATVDALSSSCSMFKYFFDMCIGGTADQMHELMLTPEYIAAIAAETIFFVSFALFAEYMKDKKDANKSAKKTSNHVLNQPSLPLNSDSQKETTSKFNAQSFASTYPYVRDVMKGLKNGYKGWRGAITAVNLLHIANASALIFPIGLGLGIVGAANRYWMRSFREARKEMKDHNRDMYGRLNNTNFFPLKDEESIKQQKAWERCLGYVGSAFGGFVDGLYLYMGPLSAVFLAPPLLITLSAICVFYLLGCIVTRINEEYSDQAELLRTKTSYELLRRKKIIQTLCSNIHRLEEKYLTEQHFVNAYETELDELKIQSFKDELSVAIDEFDNLRTLLYKQHNTGYGSAILLGIQNSLFTYSALSSILMIGIVCGVAFPPLVLAPIICSGVLLMIAFIAHAMLQHYQFKSEGKQEQIDNKYNEILDVLSVKLNANNLPSSECVVSEHKCQSDRLNNLLEEQLIVEFPFPDKSKVQSRAEFIRFIFSALSKSFKFAEFAGNIFQEQGADDHYYDTPVIYAFAAVLAPLFICGLAGRLLGKDFGSDAKKTAPSSSAKFESPGNKPLNKPLESKPLTHSSGVVNQGFFAPQQGPGFVRTRSANYIPSTTHVIGLD